jgi:hypothetical protein
MKGSSKFVYLSSIVVIFKLRGHDALRFENMTH